MSHEVIDFDKDVIQRSHQVPVLADFWAEWCGPCRVLGPIIERLASEAGGRWELAKVDTEVHTGVAESYGVTGIPNVKLFVNGKVADEFIGLMPEAEIRRWLDHAIPSPHAAVVADARALIERGSFPEAAEAMRRVVAEEPQNVEARLALAEAELHLEPARVEPTLKVAGDLEYCDRAGALRALARAAEAASRPEGFAESPAKAPFLRGAQAIRTGDYDAALEGLIESLRADRRYSGGAARDAGRAVFVLLGLHHPVSERHHRAFSSAVLA